MPHHTPLRRRRLCGEQLEERQLLVVYPTITLATNAGNITMELYDDTAPQTVANFLSYVNDGDFTNAIFHRVVPGFVLQGGGFRSTSQTLCNCPPANFSLSQVNAAQFEEVPADPPVPNEFERSNVRGTVSMAKLGNNPNSATNQFFVNLDDNSANLDNQNGGFTVFAGVRDMTVVDALGTGPTRNLSSLFPSTSRLSALQAVATLNQTNRVDVVRIGTITGTGVVQGSIFLDADGNGFRGTNEGGIAAVTVYLDRDNDGNRDPGEPTAQTNSLGDYEFQTEPGSATVRVDSITDFDYSRPQGPSPITVSLGWRLADQHVGLRYTGLSWRNPLNPTDVDAINGVTPLDALIVINELNDRMISDPTTGMLPPITTSPATPRFLDTTGDQIVAPLDALLVINSLSSTTNRAAMSSTATFTGSGLELDSALDEQALAIVNSSMAQAPAVADRWGSDGLRARLGSLDPAGDIETSAKGEVGSLPRQGLPWVQRDRLAGFVSRDRYAAGVKAKDLASPDAVPTSLCDKAMEMWAASDFE